MQKQTILRKEAYESYDPSAPISLKQYVIIKNNSGKILLLRLSNQLNEVCASYGFWIYQYDAHHTFLEKNQYDVKNASCIPGMFVYKDEITLDDRCAYIEFYPIYATFGDYTYTFEKKISTVQFTKPYTPSDEESSSTRRTTKKSSPHMAWPYLLIALLVVVVTFLLAGILFNLFIERNPHYYFFGFTYSRDVANTALRFSGSALRANSHILPFSNFIR